MSRSSGTPPPSSACWPSPSCPRAITDNRIPPMPKVTDEHKDAVRRRIMDAALTCLERNGFQDVTTRELLTEAGLSTGTFYNYFPSKEHLYEALAEELLSDDLERLRSTGFDGKGTGYGLLRFLSDYALVDPEAAIAVSSFRGRMHAN